jgi:hypothetical protein
MTTTYREERSYHIAARRQFILSLLEEQGAPEALLQIVRKLNPQVMLVGPGARGYQTRCETETTLTEIFDSEPSCVTYEEILNSFWNEGSCAWVEEAWAHHMALVPTDA